MSDYRLNSNLKLSLYQIKFDHFLKQRTRDVSSGLRPIDRGPNKTWILIFSIASAAMKIILNRSQDVGLSISSKFKVTRQLG